MSGKERFLEAQLEYQKRLNAITAKIHAANDTNEILLNLQNDILSLFDAERITVYAVDAKNREIFSMMKTGDEIKEIRVPINKDSISGCCAATCRLIEIANAYDDRELEQLSPQLKFNKSWDQKTGFRTNQVLAAPILYNRYLLGVIQLINKAGGGRFNQNDQMSAVEIGKVLGAAFFKNKKVEERRKSTKFDFLLNNNIISSNDLAAAMAGARNSKRDMADVLMKDFRVSREDIGKALSHYYNARFIPFQEKMVIPGQLLKGLKVNYLVSSSFVPIAEEDNRVVITMADPDDLMARDIIKKTFKAREIEFCVSIKADISSMIEHFFNIGSVGDLKNLGSIEEILGQMETEEEDLEDEIRGMSENDNVIVQLANKMIVDAYNRGASDIHVEPRQGKGDIIIRFRIDGACQVYQRVPNTYKRAIISRIKIMSDLDISERRLPQDGKIKFGRFAPLDIELRVATIPTAGQVEDVVLRLLAAGEPIKLEKMGMNSRNYKEFLNMISQPYGIVLVVGPTGSGKTTTLHAALAQINRPETKIWTAEDPVEITQDGLRQVQVQPKIGFDFAKAMRSFLRADPDVIMVGEMRDEETMSTGIEASLTGHLVFSTLHTNSAPETVIRLLDMGMDPFNFADALLGILAQRLIRTLCTKCKEKYHPARDEFDTLQRSYGGNLGSIGFPYNDDFFLYRPKGCPGCGNTGYSGRTGIHELLTGTDDLKSLIQMKAQMVEIRKQAIKDGMTTLMQDGIRKVCMGLTDLIQVRKVCMK